VEVGGHAVEEAQGDLFGVGGLTEEEQGGHRFLVHVARFEDGNHFGGETPDLGGLTPSDIDHGQIEGNQSGVEGDAPLNERVPRLPQGGFGFRQMAEAAGDLPLKPTQSYQVHPLAQLKVECSRLPQNLLGFLVLATIIQVPDEVVPSGNEEARVFERVYQGKPST